jgi:hypothetical protein
MVRVFGTDELDSQANVGHPRDVHADKDVNRAFSGSKFASVGPWISVCHWSLRTARIRVG